MIQEPRHTGLIVFAVFRCLSEYFHYDILFFWRFWTTCHEVSSRTFWAALQAEANASMCFCLDEYVSLNSFWTLLDTSGHFCSSTLEVSFWTPLQHEQYFGSWASLSGTTISHSLKTILFNSRDFPASLKKWLFFFSYCRPSLAAAQRWCIMNFPSEL